MDCFSFDQVGSPWFFGFKTKTDKLTRFTAQSFTQQIIPRNCNRNSENATFILTIHYSLTLFKSDENEEGENIVISAQNIIGLKFDATTYY